MEWTRDLSIVGNLASIASLYLCLPVSAGWIFLALREPGVKRIISYGALTILALIYLGDIGVHQGWFPTVAQGPAIAAIPHSSPRATPAVSRTATPTPVNPAELGALKEENAKLKTENARLRKTKAPRIAQVLPTPHVSITPILTPSKISADDCDALIGAQTLLDNATTDRIELGNDKVSFGTNATEGVLRYLAAQNTESQAESNLSSLRARLCVTSTTR